MSSWYLCHHHKFHGSRFGNNNRVKFFFISLYGINTIIIHLLILFEHRCHVFYLNMNVICMFVLFRYGYYVFICVIYRWKSYTQLPCLNNAWHSCLNDMNSWNNKFRMDLEQTHEVYNLWWCMWTLFIIIRSWLILKLSKLVMMW
jgi:hypothetical protein